jgi:hypothetical protein
MTDVLDLIGEDLQRAAQRQAGRSRAHEPGRRVAAWLLAAPHDGRRRPGWRSPRPLAVLLVALVGTAGAAYGAVRLIGAAAPRSTDPTVKLYVTTRSQLLGVRASDPRGGPPWGLKVSFEAHTPNPYGLPAVCVALGRVLDGHIGYLGEYGAFANDGLFHAATVASGLYGGLYPTLDEGNDNCSGPSKPHTKLTMSYLAGGFSTGEIVANGLDGCGLGPPPPVPASIRRRRAHRHQRVLSAAARERMQLRVWRSERDDLTIQLGVLRADGPAARALATRAGVSVATLRSIDAGQLPLLRKEIKTKTALGPSITRCPASAFRTYWQGFAGRDATVVTLVARGVHLTEHVDPAQEGAYLFVLAGPSQHWNGWHMLVTCGDRPDPIRALACPAKAATARHTSSTT